MIKFYIGILASTLIALIVVTLGRIGLLPEGPDHFTYDFRTYFLTKPAAAPRDDLAIVLIDEQSMTGYPYISPIDRGLTTKLLQDLADSNVKAIGLDFILDRPTEVAKDEKFIDALRTLNKRVPIVLVALDERSRGWSGGFSLQERIIRQSGVRAGHLFFSAEQNRFGLGDRVIRYMVGPSDSSSRASFASVLAGIVGNSYVPPSDLIYWQRAPEKTGADFAPSFTLPPHRDADGRLTGEILPESWRPALAGKIVLIGGAFVDRDRHVTPLTVGDGARVPGVEIHAQILAQLLDRRSVQTLAWWLEVLLVALVALAGFYAIQYWRLTAQTWPASVVAFVAFVALSSGLFWAAHIVLPTASLFIAWPAGLFTGTQVNWLERRFALQRTLRAEKSG